MVRATVVPRGSAAFPLVTLAMVAVLSSAPVGLAAAAPAGSAARSGGWQSGGWQGTADGGTSVTLADVAKAVDAAGSGLDGTGVGVALIDTGVAPVPGLPAAHVVNGPDLSFESQANTLRYLDTYGHGTNMAGIIAGNDSATGFKGLAPGARLVSVKTGTAQGSVDVSQMLAAIDWVVEHRNDDRDNPIRVLNLSYGTPVLAKVDRDPLTTAVENAWKAGIVVVVAGGNGSNNANQLTNPGYNPYVLTVGSVAPGTPASAPGSQLSAFTDTNPAGRNVDITAPGESIVSLRDPGSNIDTLYPNARVGDRLFRGSGTSQAAAVVSGAVSLLLQQRPGLTPDQVKTILKATARPLTAGVGRDQHLGVIDVGAALAQPDTSGQQSFTEIGVTNLLDASRGGVSVLHDLSPLIGQNDIFQPFDANAWTARSAAGTAWSGGTWMGERWAGDGWTGSSWAARTWAPAVWSGTPWKGGSWIDDTWSGHYWSGGQWSGHYWSGHYWSSDQWTTAAWS